MQNDLKLPKTYKTLLMLALVFGPFCWLAFTEDGQRRTDLALMFVLGKPEFNAALDAFNTGLTETKLRELFPKLRFQCATGANPFGDRLCGAGIGSFNQIPASSVTLFFLDDRLRAAKVIYRRPYHRTVRDWTRERLALREENARPPASMNGQNHQDVMAAAVGDGALFVRDGELAKEDEPALLWVSQAAIDSRR